MGGFVLTLPVFTVMPTIMTAFLAPGAVLAAILIWWLMGQLRNADQAPTLQAVQAVGLQLVIALCLWPAAAILLGTRGPGMITTLGLAFVLPAALIWAGTPARAKAAVFGHTALLASSTGAVLWAGVDLVRTFAAVSG